MSLPIIEYFSTYDSIALSLKLASWWLSLTNFKLKVVLS